MNELTSEKFKVAVIKGESPESSVRAGIKSLGGISKVIKKNDQVFIKFNLNFPYGFPTNINFDVLKTVIQCCKEAEASKIYVGSLSSARFQIKAVADSLGLEDFLKTYGAEFIYLDNSNIMNLKLEELKKIKSKSFSEILIKKKKYLIPNIFINSDKFLIVNQASVNPLFKFNFSLLNYHTIINSQQTKQHVCPRSECLSKDLYKRNIIEEVFDIYSIKSPDLIINDLFYFLEGAGPYIYKDSNLKETGLIIVGNNAIAVDSITLRLLDFDKSKSDLIIKAKEIGLEPKDFSDILTVGEEIENNFLKVKPCVSRLEDIDLRKFSIKTGKQCSGCYEQAYHFLNLLKSSMLKGIKYISNSSFLAGEAPPEPEFLENTILFGDCAVYSTENYQFRKIFRKIEKIPKKSRKSKMVLKPKEFKSKIKTKKNKKILELPGCPPNFIVSIEKLIKYYGKSDVPALNLFWSSIKPYFKPKTAKKMEEWGKL